MATLADIAGRRFSALMAEGASTARNTKLGKVVRKFGVPNSSEYQRVAALPRRDWRSDTTLPATREKLHSLLRKPGGENPCGPMCRCPRSLWDEQVVALIEGATNQGVFCPLGVGKGKALLSILLAQLTNAERPLLLVPAQLREQTNERVLPMTRRHWFTNPRLRVHGYSELSVASGKRMLLDYRPTLLILDEAQSVRNSQSARGKRIREYLKEEPETVVVPLSGSMTKRSLLDYWQLLLWSHKPDRCPIPNEWMQVKDWACALDTGLSDLEQIGPGILMRLCNEGETVREGYRRRLVETPSVVASGEEELDVSLVIGRHDVRVPAHIQNLMGHMRKYWETPDGNSFTEAIEMWRHMRQLACGFWYKWDPAAPRDWLDARKAWKAWAREAIRTNRRSLDSELVLVSHLDIGPKSEKWRKEDEQGVALLDNWRKIKGTFEPNTVAQWESDFALEAASLWLKTSDDDEHPQGGIVWTESVAFGERLAKESGRVYYGAGMDASRAILDAKGPFIASIAAHGTGKNLQERSRNLVCTPPASGDVWEQLIGRTHRAGQVNDTVEIDVWLHAEELFSSLRKAKQDALYIEDTIGARQKLCFADWSFNLGEG
jgi:hypothetical protein